MRTDGIWFKDEAGRVMLLRGANLGGSNKVPTRPNGATYIRDGFFEHRDLSFVGRPFPLEEADEHFGRLHAWGMQARQALPLRLAGNLDVDLLRPQAGPRARHGGHAARPGDDEVQRLSAIEISCDQAANPFVRVRQPDIDDPWRHLRIGYALTA